MSIEWAINNVLAGSARPGRYLGARVAVPEQVVRDWIEAVRLQGISSIICLLDEEQLSLYREHAGDLLALYGESGFHVTHEPVRDHLEPPLTDIQLGRVWASFQALPTPVLIHCSAGIGRTRFAIAHIRQKLAESPG